MDWKVILSQTYDMLVTPAIVAILGVLSYLGTKLLKQIKSIMSSKMELFGLQAENEIRQQVFDLLDSTVEAAVGSNMQLATKMKKMSADGKLDADEVKELHDSCIGLIEHSLPPSLLKADSSTVGILGGLDKVNSMINTLIEKHVFEYNADLTKCQK